MSMSQEQSLDDPNRHSQLAPVKSQDVRVDNWGNYCLQRLQSMYDRGDFCDLILQFHTNQILKVHRVVVNLCTEYFANLERCYGLSGGMLVLPKDIEYSTMVTIVKFFYTGKLEVKSTQFNDIYRTVKLMNILILTKLLEAHARKPIAMAKKEPSRPIIFKQAVDMGRPLHAVQTSTVQQGSTIKVAPNNTTVTTSRQTITRPLLPGMKTKTVLARVQPQNTVRVANHQGKLSTPKKLPIWKERKYSPATNADPLMLEKWPPRDEPPRPTRFEWPDPDEDPYLTPATHTLMERQKAAGTNRKAEDIFDAVKSQSHGGLVYGVKRSINTVTSTVTTDGSPASKLPKLMEEELITTSINSVDITSAEESSMSDVNLTDDTIEEEVSTTEGYHCQDSVESTTVEGCSSVASSLFSDESSTSSIPSDISTTTSPSTSKHVNNNISLETLVQAKRSSIKSTDTLSSPHHKIEKTVRFAPDVDKDKHQQVITAVVPKSLENAQSSSNHSKIISEVLKKYPDLVKDNKNIKIKIVQKESDISTSPNKDQKSKVSYIVLKSTSAPDSAGSVVLKKPIINKSFWESDKSAKKLPSGAENTTGPWLCTPCGVDDVPLEFETYYTYRRHLVDVHGERIDARICEYCGQKTSKRNLVLYHLYTKHGVPPPKNCVFPHCDRCDYVALSESLLVKHKQGHDANKEVSCTICNASFKSNGALQGHMAANLHRNTETKVYECPYCRKPFVRNINLKAHIRSLHKDVARIEEMEDPRLPPDDTLSNRGIVPAGVKKRQFPTILGGTRLQSGGGTIIDSSEDLTQSLGDGLVRSLVTADGQTIEILHSMDPNSVPVLVPSSDSETLNNVVATSIASLGLDTQAGMTSVGTEYVTGVNSDGSPAVFIMDSSAQNAVEVDVSGVGMTDGSMIFEGDPTAGSDQFIVQDLQGNQFRKITAIDETGKQVIFFSIASSVFVSSGMTLPVTVSSDVVGGQQMLLSSLGASVPAGHVIELVPGNGDVSQCDPSGTIVSTESLMNQVVQQGHVQLHPEHQHHLLQTSTGQVDHLGQPVQELHIVLGENQVEVVEKGGEMVVVPPQSVADKLEDIEQAIQDVHVQVMNATNISHVDSVSGDSVHSLKVEQEQGVHQLVEEEEEEVVGGEQMQIMTSEQETVQQQSEVEDGSVTTTTTQAILESAILEGETGNGQVEFQECMQIVDVVQTGNGDVELQECLQSIEVEEDTQHVEVEVHEEEMLAEEQQTQQIDEIENSSVQMNNDDGDETVSTAPNIS